MTLRTLGLVCVFSTALAAAPATNETPPPPATLDTSVWGLRCDDFFGKGSPLTIYPARRDGKWIAAMGSSRIPGSAGSGRYAFNRSKAIVDMSAVAVTDETVKGTIKVTLTADPWVPRDHKPRFATIEIDAKVLPPSDDDAKKQLRIQGHYTAKIDADVNKDAKPGESATASGAVIGAVGNNEARDLSSYTVDLMLEGAIPGGQTNDIQRRMPVVLYVRDGVCCGGEAGSWMWRGPYDMQAFEPAKEIKYDKDRFIAKFSVRFVSLDAEYVNIDFDLQGGIVQNNALGQYTSVVTYPDGRKETRQDYFSGGISPGAREVRFVKDERPWFVATKDFKPLQSGEHPRLFFRKTDLPELRRRAATPEGKQIIARLKQLLGGGEEMPRSYNPTTVPVSDGAAVQGWKPEEGSYTISHAAGFGFLYQLTEDKKYADLSRKCVELALKGQRDKDNRYSLVWPWGELRAGPSLGWYAAAYDLCYDAWDPDFRTSFAQFLQNYQNTPLEKEGEGINLRRMAMAPGQGPNSNHYGSIVGGCGMAVLAIMGDPGTDGKLLEIYDRAIQIGVTKALNGGFGDGGYFAEGMGPGQIFTDTGFVPYLQALRTAAGRDYIKGPRPNARNLTMVRVWEMIGPPAWYPYRSCMPGSYGGPDFAKHRDGLSRGGQFCQGFGAVSDEMKPALLWTFNNIVEPDRAKRTFDTISDYPHRPMMALINWPEFGDMKEKNPGELLPKYHRDSIYEYWIFRNRWQDKDDTVVTFVLNDRLRNKPGGIMVSGLGERVDLPSPETTYAKGFVIGEDRSGIVWTEDGNSIAVDFSQSSGADTLVVVAPVKGKANEPKKAGTKSKLQTITAGDITYVICSLSEKGTHPEVKVDGNGLVIGKQTVKCEDGRIVLGVFTPAK